MENKLITPKELYDYFNKGNREIIGLKKIYSLIKRKDFPSLKIGGKFFIIEQKVDEWLNKQAEKFWC
jgi:hypothetical protein